MFYAICLIITIIAIIIITSQLMGLNIGQKVEHYTVGANNQVCKVPKYRHNISQAYKYLNNFPHYTPHMLNRYPVTYYYPYSYKKYYPTYTYI